MIIDNSVADETARVICRVAAGAGAAVARAGESVVRRCGEPLPWDRPQLELAQRHRTGRAQAFGFIDHDIFPTATADPFAPLAGQDVYGIIRTAGRAGFCGRAFACSASPAVKDKALDFGQDWFVGLDTGGGNWSALYSRIERGHLQEPPTHPVSVQARN